MKKKITYSIFCVALLFFSFNVCSQTLRERQQISKSYINSGNSDEITSVIQDYMGKQRKAVDSLVSIGLKKSFKVGRVKYELLRVSPKGEPIYYSTDNVSAANSTQTQYLHNDGGLGINVEGQNMIIGIWDAGVAHGGHQEFIDENGNSVVTAESSYLSSNDDHATHVLGTMISRGVRSNAKGMAPMASAVSYDWGDDLNEVNLEASNGLLISNHSYGTPIFINGSTNVPPSGIGTYNSEAKAWDGIHYAYPYYLQVASAGNDGSEENINPTQNGFDQIIGEKVSKNNLVVANANDVIYYSNGFVYTTINSSSSKGPSDDGRIKPDITGNGTGVYSTDSDPNDPSKTSLYRSATGTSMASPNIAGSLLLLQQYYNELNSKFMRSATLKGLVCHTATDKGNPGPDPIFGWGILNSKKAAELIATDKSKASMSEMTINNGENLQYDFVIPANTPEFAVTVCWTDPSGPIISSTNSQTPVLVNDIDITITKGQDIYYPYRLNYNSNDKLWSWASTDGDNSVDNIEQIRIANPVAGNYSVNVTHKGNLTNNKQDFSIIITGHESSTSLNFEDNLFSDIVIYPNPVSGNSIYITGLNEDFQASLYDINGKKIIQVSNGENNISMISPGVYFLKMKNSRKSLAKRIIIQ